MFNWKFWKKTQPEEVKPEPRRLEVPAEKVQEIRRLRDNHMAAPANADKETHYLLWTEIAKIFPEVREGSWLLTFPGAFRAEIVEQLD